jgi:hypothetical protein
MKKHADQRSDGRLYNKSFGGKGFCKKNEWTGRELNPRPLPCQGSDLPLIYQPASQLVGCHRLKELGFGTAGDKKML